MVNSLGHQGYCTSKSVFRVLGVIGHFYNDVKWYFPKMKNGQLLSVPVQEGDNPLCAYFVKDISRQNELIDYGALL